jgi:uncharacterized protein (DUF885 family)
MNRLYRLVLLCFGHLIVTGCATTQSSNPATPSDAARTAQVESIVDQYFEEYLKLFPLFASSIGDHRYDDQLENTDAAEHREKYLSVIQGALQKVQDAGGCVAGHLTCEIFLDDLQSQQELVKNPLYYRLPFDQFDSFFLDFAELSTGSSYITFDKMADYRNFLNRMKKVPAILDTQIINMRTGIKYGQTTPRVLVDRGLDQMAKLLSPAFEELVFYKPLLTIREKLKGEATPEEIRRLMDEYVWVIRLEILPAYRKLQEFVKYEYRPKARTSTGIYQIPFGKEYYQALIRSHTTTNLTPAQIMRLGQDEVARISKQFDEVKEKLGHKGTKSAFFQSLRTGAAQYPFKTAEEVLGRYHDIHKKLMDRVSQRFRIMPKCAFEIREVEKFKAETASEAYQNGTADGSRPGIFWVPIPNPEKYPVKDMESLFLHEAIPGHHFQISIQQELSLPRYRRFGGNNAYVEGWALYTESLGRELGLYEDPMQWVGRLTGEMHRAIRLVVDTGMHAFGWSREKAIDYSMKNEPGDTNGIRAEIERYMAIPGQALSYKLGEIKIRELKEHAKQVLGDRYDDRDFHDEILKDGALPLSVLDRKIRNYCQSRRQ